MTTPLDPVELFHSAAAEVPAYRAFLAEQGIDPAAVTSLAQFAQLPLLDKANYTRRYPLPQLCRGGELGDMIAVSSGSSGEPSFWPRTLADEARIADRFEQVFRDAFESGGRRTLAVVCFALGTWVGGLFTYGCCRELARRGHPVTVVAPGNNMAEILRVIPPLAPHFDQVVLLGYPPFLKDVIDAGARAGVPWAEYGIRMVTAGEVFSEEWRNLVCGRAGMADPARDTASLYGTADAGVLGNETPLSIGIRRYLAGNPGVARELFGESRLPTLVQYDPAQRFFEVREGTLLFSADGRLPLVRYHIADRGGLVEYRAMLDFLSSHGYAPANPGPELPFVYVFGRSLFTVSFYGANVYPENIAVGLEQPQVNRFVTGKFVLQTVEVADRGSELRVWVELASGVVGDEELRDGIAEVLRQQLLRLNSEFAHYVPAERQVPVVVLRPAGDPEWFPAGVKHRYTKA